MNPAPPSESIYRFQNNELRPATRQLLVGGQPTPIGARAFDLLLALVLHRDRMLAKHELLDMVWPNLVVEENNLQVQVSALRKVLGSRVITTVPGRGYRFTAPLELLPVVQADKGTLPRVQAIELASTGAASTVISAGNLPARLPVLLGRDAEVAQLRELVRARRLVSVLGTSGIGKSCLACTVAQQVASSFRDGAWLVELADAPRPSDLPAVMARTLGIHLPQQDDQIAALANRLRGQELLVLDSCEHLVESVAALVRHLMDAVPALHVLATSQEALKLSSEWSVRIEALTVPRRDLRAVPRQQALAHAMSHGAVALFVARVQAAQPSFRLDDDNLSAVIDICHQLDGVPLALEFAATRVPTLGAQGVQQHLAQRLRLLNNGPRDAPARHRTLRAALDWSHALLNADEQKVFRRLGVFAGGFSLELAQQVASDECIDAWAVLDHLGALVDKSLIVANLRAVPRYRLLETTRAYAGEQLGAAGEEGAFRQRHARCMQHLIDPRERLISHGGESWNQWVTACYSEIDNLRGAIEWACGPAGDGVLALQLVNTAAALMDQIGRHSEGLRWMKLAAPFIGADTPPLVVAQYHLGLAMLGSHGGIDAPQRLALLAQARKTFEQQARPESHLVIALCLSACVAGVSGDWDDAEHSLAQAGHLIGLPHLKACCGIWRYATGMVRRFQGRPEDARAAYEMALPLAKAEGHAHTLFCISSNLAAVCQELGRIDEAISRFRALIAQLQISPVVNHALFAFAHIGCAHAFTAQGALDEAQDQVEQGVPHCQRSLGLRHFAGVLAWLAARQGRLRDAALLIGAADAARAQRGEGFAPSDLQALRATEMLIRTQHADSKLSAWRLEGAELNEDAVLGLLALRA